MMKKMVLYVLLAISMVVSACSKTENGGEAVTEVAVETTSKTVVDPGERAVGRWQALIDDDWDKAYTYETPGYRSSYSVKDLKASHGNAVTWKSIKLVSTEVNEENGTADVGLELTTLFLDAGGGEMLIPNFIKERWLLKDGQWWYVRK